MKFLGKYMQIKKRDIGIAWKKAKYFLSLRQ